MCVGEKERDECHSGDDRICREAAACVVIKHKNKVVVQKANNIKYILIFKYSLWSCFHRCFLFCTSAALLIPNQAGKLHLTLAMIGDSSAR